MTLLNSLVTMAGRQKQNDILSCNIALQARPIMAMDAEPHNTTHQEGRKVLFVGDHDPSWLGGRGNAVLHVHHRSAGVLLLLR